jgi:GH43 family beta-xylosidase
MNKLTKAIKQCFIEALMEQTIIRKKDGKYYSTCAVGEEITIELKKIFEDD